MPRSSPYLEIKCFGSIPSPHPVHDETKNFGSTPLPHPLDAAAKNIEWQVKRQLTTERDIHSLQYKIINCNRYIPCKVNLQLWGKSSSDKCHLCDEVDTIEHFFSQCTYNELFWQDVFFGNLYQINNFKVKKKLEKC